MDLSKLLLPGAVRVVGQFTSKKRLFQELAETAAQACTASRLPWRWTVCRNARRWGRRAWGTASRCRMPGLRI
jgi:hypothetical protein